MAYTPTTWECGDAITAAKLNNLEGGVQEALECCGSGTLAIVERTDETTDVATLNKTWQEIYDAMSNGVACNIFIIEPDEQHAHRSFVVDVFFNDADSNYQVYAMNYGGGFTTQQTYTADTASGYPTA